MKRLILLSISINIVMVAVLVWMWRYDQDHVWSMMGLAHSTESTHMAIHTKSLEALESEDPAVIADTARMLRMLVENWERNQELLAKLPGLAD